MPLDEGTALLRGRYELGRRRSAAGDAEAWTAYDEDGVPYLARTWAYDGDEPDPFQRALWDAELRTLYKVGSSPGADDTLAVLKDAVSTATRSPSSWSCRRPATTVSRTRSRLGRSTAGSPPATPPSGATFGGRWPRRRWAGRAALPGCPAPRRRRGSPAVPARRACRVHPARRLRVVGPARPPAGRRPAGRLVLAPRAARWRHRRLAPRRRLVWLRHAVRAPDAQPRAYANNAPAERYARVLKAIETATTKLTEPERALLLRLIDPDPLERMTRPHDVQLAVRGIVALLAAPPTARADDRPFTLIVNPKNARLYDYLLERGLREHLGLDDGQPYDPRDTAHTDGLAVFLRRDLDGGSLYAVPRQETVLLVGRRTVIRLGKYADRGEAPTWQTAFCLGPAQLKHSEGGPARVRIPPVGSRSVDQGRPHGPRPRLGLRAVGCGATPHRTRRRPGARPRAVPPVHSRHASDRAATA